MDYNTTDSSEKIEHLEQQLAQAQQALQASETRFRNIIEKNADGIIVVDHQGVVRFINAAAESLLKRRAAELLDQLFGFPLVAGDTTELDIVRHGESLVAEMRVVESEWEGQSVFLASLRDITERKQVEKTRATLEARNRQLQKAESLSLMAGAIAHHFNNQLQAVMGYLELALIDHPPHNAADRNLAQAMVAAERAAEMSSLMLVYLGQTPDTLTPLDLAETCTNSMAALQETTPPHITLTADFPTPGPIINANTIRIQQLLTNLVTNAWETIADKPGSIQLAVKTVTLTDIPTTHRFPLDWHPQEQTYACLEVTDTGAGITGPDIDKLFDPFFSTKFTGRGLGLAVVLGIVRTHSGAVTVTSTPGQGSTFRLFFPMMAAEERPTHPDHKSRIPEIPGGGTLLLVEDDELVREVVEKMLRKLGFMVLTASDGVEAVEIFRQHRDEIICVLCDLSMPRMDGWETLLAIRQLAPDIPVILSSGYDESKVMAGYHPELPQAFLSKPYQMNRVSQIIHQVLDIQKTKPDYP